MTIDEKRLDEMARCVPDDPVCLQGPEEWIELVHLARVGLRAKKTAADLERLVRHFRDEEEKLCEEVAEVEHIREMGQHVVLTPNEPEP